MIWGALNADFFSIEYDGEGARLEMVLSMSPLVQYV
jgi:hypothetical protein